MKTKTLNKLIKDYQLIFTNLGFTLNPDFKKEYLHIKRMKGNSTKISYIKSDRIEKLQENIKGFKLKPNDTEQREKYFTAVKPSKFLDSMIIAPTNRTTLFNSLSEQFTRDFISNLKTKLVLFSGSDISRVYNTASVVGCMARAYQSWFEVYDKTENLQLATLTDEEDTVLIRSLLWYDKDTNNYWLDNSYEQTSVNGDNEIRKEYQKKLITEVLTNLMGKEKDKDILTFGFGCKFTDSLDTSVIKNIQEKFNIQVFRDVKRKIVTETINTGRNDKDEQPIYRDVETERSKEKILLKPVILNFDSDDFESFPYSDTFQSIGRHSGKWFIHSNSGDNDFICCTSTEGEDENDSGTVCECCDCTTHEDEIRYSEVEEEYICDDCSTYVEERDDVCREENALYNNYTGCSIYKYDIQ